MWTVVYYNFGVKIRAYFTDEEDAVWFAKNKLKDKRYKLAKKCIFDPDGDLIMNDKMIKELA